ncbi:MAG: DUF4388 domain-containing protein [Thermoanaerobaculia bacterium]
MTTPSLQGQLDAFKFPDLLTFLGASHKTGMLTLASDGKEAYVFIRNGAVVYAASNQESHRLGTILLRRKQITREQSEAITDAMLRGAGPFGKVVVEEGILSEGQLHDALKVQVSEVIYDGFVWSGGGFTFYDGFDLPANAVTISIDLPNLIMEGARRIEEWEECLQLLPDSAVVFRVVANPDTDKITLSVVEWKILFLINGDRTLEELCHDAHEDSFQVYRVVYGLFANKLIEPVTPAPDDEEHPSTVPTPAMPDETVRQDLTSLFSGDSTIIEKSDDKDLLISPGAKLSYKDVVSTTLAQLHVVKGDAPGTAIPLTEPEYVIGRQRDAGIHLTDLGVSGRHARIYRGPEGYTIEDLKSRNGTFLNGTRAFLSLLKDGDTISVGGTDLRYEILFDGSKSPTRPGM